MKPEEKAEIILWDWLRTKGKSIKEIYFNRVNKLGCKSFKVRGIKKIPDLIIAIDQGYGLKYIVVEVKSSNQSKNILDAKKIIDYYCLYVRGETQYYIDNQEIEISHFLVASDKSKLGYLFEEEELLDSLTEDSKEGKKNAIRLGLIPRFEGYKTCGYVRGSLWKWFEDIRKEYDKKCGLGILIGDVDSGYVPKMMINSYNENKKRWGQRWWEL